MKWPSFNKSIFLALSVFFLLSFLVCGVAYVVIREFTFVHDYVIYGKSQRDLAQEIRVELLKRPDIKEVSFYSREDIKLSGFLLKRQNATANVLLCHGYRGSKEFMYGYLDLFPKFNMLLFDFRAHGQSEGSVISVGCHEYKDIIAASRYLRDTTKLSGGNDLPLIILGISMGGACALRALVTNPDLADVLIIDSTYSDLHKMLLKGFALKSGLPYYPFFPVVRWMFQYFASCDVKEMNTIECSKKIKIPVFFIHACNDQFISPNHSVKLYANSASRCAQLWIGPLCNHGWLHSKYPDLYKKKVVEFLTVALPGVQV